MADRMVMLPSEAAKSIASCIRREAKRLLYRTNPSPRDIRHGNRLLVFAELIYPSEDK